MTLLRTAPSPVICRTLAREYRLHLANEEDRARFAFMAIDPQIEGADLEVVDIEIESVSGFYSMRLPNGVWTEGTSSHCLSYLHGLVRWDMRRAHPNCPLVHGASVLIDGKRVMIVAAKGAGKSTLSLHLLARGHACETDENVVVRPDDVIAFPRTLRVKPNTLSVIRNLAPEIWDAPSFTSPQGMVLRAISPAAFGRPWIIRPGQLDAIVFVEPNHGGRSVSFPISPDETCERLFGNSYYLPGSVVQMAARLRRLGTETPGFTLRLGSLDSAEKHLVRILAA